jgi:2-dehydropantoate 2-reductase
MKIAAIGAGGVGYGAALDKAGEEVTFVARGAHLAAVQANGLRVEGGRDTTISPVHATDNCREHWPGRHRSALHKTVGA